MPRAPKRRATGVGRLIVSDDCVAEGAAWLAVREPRFAGALAVTGPLPLRLRPEGFAALLNAIMAQQVSVASAEAIWQKLLAAGLTGEEAVAKADEDALRQCGLSRQKIRYAKALAHAPQVLFLDEPTAGVDVELRKGMWEIVRQLRAAGTTIILTTHYIEEAEAIADRVAVINEGRIVLVEERDRLIRQMGRKELSIELKEPLPAVPDALASYGLELAEDGRSLRYAYDRAAERTGIVSLLRDLSDAGLTLRDLRTRESSLEDIFVDLVRKPA